MITSKTYAATKYIAYQISRFMSKTMVLFCKWWPRPNPDPSRGWVCIPHPEPHTSSPFGHLPTEHDATCKVPGTNVPRLRGGGKSGTYNKSCSPWYTHICSLMLLHTKSIEDFVIPSNLHRHTIYRVDQRQMISIAQKYQRQQIMFSRSMIIIITSESIGSDLECFRWHLWKGATLHTIGLCIITCKYPRNGVNSCSSSVTGA